jgi:type II secretory pathway component PulF
MSGFDRSERASDPQQPTVGSAVLSAAVMVVVHGLVGLAVCLFLLFVVPGYKRTLADFQMRVPAFTEWVIAVSDWLGHYLYVMPPFVLIVLVVDAAALFLLRWKRQTRPLSWVWFMVVLLLPLTAWLLGWWGVWLANLKLQEGLSR